MPMTPERPDRSHYAAFVELTTRWGDNDIYGHVNNVIYYALFDSAVNRQLIEAGVLDPATSPVIGLVVETGCRFFAPLSFPETVAAGLRVAKLGTSSVRYELGLFRAGEAGPAAEGHFVHVYVERASRRPAPIPEPTRAVLEALRRG